MQGERAPTTATVFGFINFFYFIMEIEIVAGQARDIDAIEVGRAPWKAPALRASSLSFTLRLDIAKGRVRCFYADRCQHHQF